MRISEWEDGVPSLLIVMIHSSGLVLLPFQYILSVSEHFADISQRLLGLSWTYHLPRSMPQPSVLFEQPLCAEVMGAGFQKIPFSQYYELRWPRLQKIFPPDERKWTEGQSQSHPFTPFGQVFGVQR
jgi:hypothetical protein